MSCPGPDWHNGEEAVAKITKVLQDGPLESDSPGFVYLLALSQDTCPFYYKLSTTMRRSDDQERMMRRAGGAKHKKNQKSAPSSPHQPMDWANTAPRTEKTHLVCARSWRCKKPKLAKKLLTLLFANSVIVRYVMDIDTETGNKLLLSRKKKYIEMLHDGAWLKLRCKSMDTEGKPIEKGWFKFKQDAASSVITTLVNDINANWIGYIDPRSGSSPSRLGARVTVHPH